MVADRSEQAAIRFEVAVQEALSQVANTPDRWPIVDERHRIHLVKRCPYYIVYRTEGDAVHVVAVAHGRRRSEYWKGR